MSWRTRDAIASLGLPIPDHRSRQATVQELDSADLVIALAREHVAWMRRVHPRAAPRTATLKRLARDLPDDGTPLVDRLAAMHLARGRARTRRGRARSRGRRSRRVPRVRAGDRRPSALRHSPAVGFCDGRGPTCPKTIARVEATLLGRGRAVRDRRRRGRRRHDPVVQESDPHAARSLGEVGRLRRQHLHARDRRRRRAPDQLRRARAARRVGRGRRSAIATTCSPAIGSRSSARTARSG